MREIFQMKPFVKRWFQYGKSIELMSVHDMLQSIIEMELKYRNNDLSHLKGEAAIRGVLISIGLALNNLGYHYVRQIRPGQEKEDSDWPRTDKKYYAKTNIPPWIREACTQYEI